MPDEPVWNLDYGRKRVLFIGMPLPLIGNYDLWTLDAAVLRKRVIRYEPVDIDYLIITRRVVEGDET